MADFFAMGGYAGYVWPAYGAALLVLVGLLIASLRMLRRCETALALLEAERPRRGRRRDANLPPKAADQAGSALQAKPAEEGGTP
ncbi:MAG: heme exporter protein CcmD [Azospirillum sp.]|nr:heme exporter protein CcmD [Azospirillum sp.]